MRKGLLHRIDPQQLWLISALQPAPPYLQHSGTVYTRTQCALPRYMSLMWQGQATGYTPYGTPDTFSSASFSVESTARPSRALPDALGRSASGGSPGGPGSPGAS